MAAKKWTVERQTLSSEKDLKELVKLLNKKEAAGKELMFIQSQNGTLVYFWRTK